MNQLETYLKFVFPWGTDTAHLFKCVTYTWGVDAKTGRPMFANHAAQGWDELNRLIKSRQNRPNANMYVGLGTLAAARHEEPRTRDGYLKVYRKASNVHSFNSVFLDIDVKEDAYASTDDAFAALDDFINRTGLPPATMEVLSGTGGVHVYWCTPVPMLLNQWTPLAKALRDAAMACGLKFDPACTIDAARILRIPGTWNHKTVPPRAVTLLDDCSFQLYNYQDLVNVLQPYMNLTAQVVPVQGAAAVAGSRSGISQNFTAGVSDSSAPPAPLEAITAICPAVSDTLAKGGAGQSEPLWNQMMYLASFTTDPKGNAHLLSKGYAKYDPAEVDKKLAEKFTARANNPGAGWPQCATIAQHHPACQGCPLLPLAKSPLNHIVRSVQAQGPAPVVAAFQQGPDPIMPDGYRRDVNGHVWGTVVDNDGSAHHVDLLAKPVLDAGIDEENFGVIVIKTTVAGVDSWSEIDVPKCLATNGAAAKTVGDATKIAVPKGHQKPLGDFVVAWLNKLQNDRRFVRAATLGWSQDGSSFSFNGTTYAPAGDTVTFQRSHDDRYSAKGDLKPWQDAMRLVYGAPALETIVACAFASPLVDMSITASLIVSAYSKETGAGKSTAFQLGQAVWGDPVSGMSGLDDTYNSVMKKAQDIKNLPIYYDELKTKDQMEKAINIVFSMTQGKAKARLNRDSTQMHAGTFRLMFCVASNYGIADLVWAGTEATEAGGVRVFEMRVPPMPQSTITPRDSERMKLSLTSNYGRAGELFGAYLAHNRAAVNGFLDNTYKSFDAEFKFEVKERFWSATMTAIMAGAVLANHLGLASFDLSGIRAYLGETLTELRRGLNETYKHTAMSDPDDGLVLLDEMKSALRTRHMITTNVINYPSAGRQFQIRLEDMFIDQLARMDNIWMQVGVTDGRIRVVRSQFSKWLRERHYNPQQVLEMLKRHYIITPGKATIGAGIPGLNQHAQIGQMHCYDFTPLNAPGSTPGAP